MQGITRRSNTWVSLIMLNTRVNSTCIEQTQYLSSIIGSDFRPSRPLTLRSPLASSVGFSALFSCLSSLKYRRSIVYKDNAESDENSDDDDDDNGYGDFNIGSTNLFDRGLAQDVKTILDVLRLEGRCSLELENKLEQCGITASSKLVLEVLSQVRNDCEAAFAFFTWAGKQPGYAHAMHEYHSMISIFGKVRKFDNAWSLINDMRGGRIGPSLVTANTLLIMMRRYSAVHDVGNAINAFYAHKSFQLKIGIEEFQNLLCSLCKYKNVEDAEHLLFHNRNVFPFSTKSFNIILDGWCNVIVSLRAAKRFWGEMGKRGIRQDVVSYASIISCYSKANRLDVVLKLFNQMKEKDISPDRKVYNAVIHALAKGRLVKEARNLMRTMEDKGISPNTATYNSLLKPICRTRKIDEAREVFDEMLQRHLSQTTRTFHAFFRILRTPEEVLVLLEDMKKLGCQPNNDTYIMLIRKFCQWRKLDDVFNLWNEMRENGINPDRSSYIVLVHGLFLNQRLEEAHKYYVEMKKKLLLPEPKIEEMIQTWLTNKQMAGYNLTSFKDSQMDCSNSGKKAMVTSKKFDQEIHFCKKVVRERGVSFWEH